MLLQQLQGPDAGLRMSGDLIGRPAFGDGRQLFWGEILAGLDVGMEFGDVGRVRIFFAINSAFSSDVG